MKIYDPNQILCPYPQDIVNMLHTLTLVLPSVLLLTLPTAQEAAITTKGISKTLKALASPEMKGRRVGSPENKKAQLWIRDRFAAIGLEPAVKGKWFHSFQSGKIQGRNVAGILRAKNATEYVIVGAHFDGVGDTRLVQRPAADDNASGVAGMLEIAEACAAKRSQQKRHIVFVAYDAEEVGLVGSRAFVQDDIIPIDQTRFQLVFDMIGGKFFPWLPKAVIAMGSEHSPQVRTLVKRKLQDLPTRVDIIGTYVLEPMGPMISRSDYQAYRAEEIPYLFLSTGTPWYYHKSQDTIDRVDLEQAREISEFAFDVLWTIASTDIDLEFIRHPKPEVQDLVKLQRMATEILKHRDAIHLDEKKFAQLEKLATALSTAIDKSKASTRLAHQALIQIFQAAARSRPTRK